MEKFRSNYGSIKKLVAKAVWQCFDETEEWNCDLGIKGEKSLASFSLREGIFFSIKTHLIKEAKRKLFWYSSSQRDQNSAITGKKHLGKLFFVSLIFHSINLRNKLRARSVLMREQLAVDGNTKTSLAPGVEVGQWHLSYLVQIEKQKKIQFDQSGPDFKFVRP